MYNVSVVGCHRIYEYFMKLYLPYQFMYFF